MNLCDISFKNYKNMVQFIAKGNVDNMINLHTHSSHSLDGNMNINDVVNQCLINKISYISITDHDNCDAYLEFDPNEINNNGTLIYGMEADAIINNITYDILCYGFELDKVRAWAKNQYGTIASRQTKIYNKLVEDLLPLQPLLKLPFQHI